MDEAFGLSEREMEDEPQGQHSLNGEGGVLSLAAWLAVLLWSPCADGFLREPERDVASCSERLVIFAPIADP